MIVYELINWLHMLGVLFYIVLHKNTLYFYLSVLDFRDTINIF